MGAHFRGAIVKSGLGRPGKGELPGSLTWDSGCSWWYPTSNKGNESSLAKYSPESGFKVFPGSDHRNCSYLCTFVGGVRAKGTLYLDNINRATFI